MDVDKVTSQSGDTYLDENTEYDLTGNTEEAALNF